MSMVVNNSLLSCRKYNLASRGTHTWTSVLKSTLSYTLWSEIRLKHNIPVSHLKVWLKQNKFYITIAHVTKHKKTNKMVFVWRKSVKYIKNWSPSNIAFLYYHSNTDSNIEVASDPWSSWSQALGVVQTVPEHCPGAQVQTFLCNFPVYSEW